MGIKRGDIELAGLTKSYDGVHTVVQGINLVSLLWTDGDRHLPCDYRIYHDPKEATKNDHFRAMLPTARQRGFQPRCVLFDAWYSSLENLKVLRAAHSVTAFITWPLAASQISTSTGPPILCALFT